MYTVCRCRGNTNTKQMKQKKNDQTKPYANKPCFCSFLIWMLEELVQMQNNRTSSGDSNKKKCPNAAILLLNEKCSLNGMTLNVARIKQNNINSNQSSNNNKTYRYSKIRIHFHLIIEIKCYCATVNCDAKCSTVVCIFL